MEFIRTIREKQQTAREEKLQQEAERTITLSDFADTLYIAHNGTPLMSIDENWTPKRIVQELAIIRQNYVKARQKTYSRGVAAL